MGRGEVHVGRFMGNKLFSVKNQGNPQPDSDILCEDSNEDFGSLGRGRGAR